TPTTQSAATFGFPGASPAISWNGSDSATGIVWLLNSSGFVTSSPAVLYAYRASDLAYLYSSPATSGDPNAAGAAVKFAVPTVANGKVYVGTQTEISVYGLQ